MNNNPQHANVAFSYAPGKIILVGEHAVVYGAKAIAMPIDCGVRVAVMPYAHHAHGREGPMLRGLGPFFMGDTFIDGQTEGPQIFKAALEYLVKVCGPRIKDLAIVVDGTLSPGCGLGSSAALSVALIKGVHQFLGLELLDAALHEHVMALETVFHGQASGIDQSVVIEGRPLAFKKSDGKIHITPLNLGCSLTFVIAISGSHEGTKNAVTALKNRMQRQEAAYNRLFSGLNDLALEMETALKVGHRAQVGELMNIAQGYLNALSLSTPQIEQLCGIARDRGALGAKLTGAGGGGAVIVLVDGNERELAQAFKAAGYQSIVAHVAHRPGENYESCT